VKLTKAQKLLVLEIAFCSSMTTGRWRDFVPLSNKGLVEVESSDSSGFYAAYGASMRRVEPTPRAREVADALMSDASLWHHTANEHAARQRRLEERRRCPCVCCATAWRMRPVAA